jgi:hypothetical protein
LVGITFLSLFDDHLKISDPSNLINRYGHHCTGGFPEPPAIILESVPVAGFRPLLPVIPAFVRRVDQGFDDEKSKDKKDNHKDESVIGRPDRQERKKRNQDERSIADHRHEKPAVLFSHR